MQEYILYLDESGIGTHFSISGLIVKKEKIEMLEQGLREIKKCIWDEQFIQDKSPILHCVELTRIRDYREKEQKLEKIFLEYPDYNVLNSKTSEEIKQIYDNIYYKFCKLLKELDTVIIGCVIDKKNLSYLYGNTFNHTDEFLFDMAFKSTIENFSYFLKKNNGIGSIIYESRNGDCDYSEKSKDYKMFDTFCKIKTNGKGMTFCDDATISKTIRYLHIYSKSDNIAGLQVADFIAYNFMQYEKLKDKNKKTEFMKRIYSRLYNGGYDISDKDLRSYFGLRKIPFDYEEVFSLQSQLKKLKKAHENLKTERNNLIRKKEKLEILKVKLVEENKILKENIDNQE